MTNKSRINPAHSWELVKDKIIQNTINHIGPCPTIIDGFSFHRNTSNEEPKPHFFDPVIIIVVQGEKLIQIGTEDHHYGEKICFISGIDMPVTSCVMKASQDKPYLAMSLYLDVGLINNLATKIPRSPRFNNSLSRGAMIQAVEPDLLDAFVRLIELTEKPEQIPIMKDLLMQEIHYKLLISPFGNTLRTLNTFGSQGNQIAQAITWLKNNYKMTLQIEDLAARSNMASSTFHKYFKEITSISPLQYQKQLRLNEAQNLMLSKGYDVTQAAMDVGYESATQFIREYKRLFGEPPRKNIVNTLKKRTEFYQLSN